MSTHYRFGGINNKKEGKRMRKGTRGNQVDWVIITGSNDNTSNNTTNDDLNEDEWLQKLAG